MMNSTNSRQAAEIFTALLLAVATVATAWSAYQSTLWGGVQTFRLSEAAATGREAAVLALQGQQQRAVDTAIFLEYLAALSQDNEPLVEFYTKRVHGEFEVALDAWLATDPFEDPQAPAHPFVMEEYSLTVDTLAAAKREEASGHIEQAKDANHISDAYVLNTVLMALVLFFAGIAPKFSSTGVRRVVLALGTLMLIGGLARVTTLPITVG